MSALRTGRACWLLLALLQVLWYGLLRAPPPPLRLPLLLLALLPLALPLLARTPARRLWWAAVAALLYFCHGVMQAWSAAGAVRALGLAEAVLAVLLVGASGAHGLHLRRLRSQRCGGASP